MSKNKDFPLHLLSEDQKDFILQTVEFHNYFGWEDGLVHKLGVREYIGEVNPKVPIVRCEALLIFRGCTFDSFVSVPNLDNIRYSECTFLSMEGYSEVWNPSLYSISLPSFLWGADTLTDWWTSLRYSGQKFVLPSTGYRFISSVDLIPEISQAFDPLYRVASHETGDLTDPETARSITESFERIWLRKLRMDFPGIFFDEVSKLLPHDRKRAIELADMTDENFELLRAFNEKIL